MPCDYEKLTAQNPDLKQGYRIFIVRFDLVLYSGQPTLTDYLGLLGLRPNLSL